MVGEPKSCWHAMRSAFHKVRAWLSAGRMRCSLAHVCSMLLADFVCGGAATVAVRCSGDGTNDFLTAATAFLAVPFVALAFGCWVRVFRSVAWWSATVSVTYVAVVLFRVLRSVRFDVGCYLRMWGESGWGEVWDYLAGTVTALTVPSLVSVALFAIGLGVRVIGVALHSRLRMDHRRDVSDMRHGGNGAPYLSSRLERLRRIRRVLWWGGMLLLSPAWLWGPVDEDAMFAFAAAVPLPVGADGTTAAARRLALVLGCGFVCWLAVACMRVAMWFGADDDVDDGVWRAYRARHPMTFDRAAVVIVTCAATVLVALWSALILGLLLILSFP